jgi:hypothetical protein
MSENNNVTVPDGKAVTALLQPPGRPLHQAGRGHDADVSPAKAGVVANEWHLRVPGKDAYPLICSQLPRLSRQELRCCEFTGATSDLWWAFLRFADQLATVT